MKKIIGFLFILPALLLVSTTNVSADNSAISSMVGIIMHLKHYPSDSEKQTLANIIHNHHATTGEKTLAGALMRMRHSVQGDDATALQALRSDKQASHAEQELADILLGIMHHPSANDIQRLQSLSKKD